MSRVIAVPDNYGNGPYIGFLVDHEMLECSECTETYHLRYTEDEQNNLAEHRSTAHRLIGFEHPKHRDDIEIPL